MLPHIGGWAVPVHYDPRECYHTEVEGLYLFTMTLGQWGVLPHRGGGPVPVHYDPRGCYHTEVEGLYLFTSGIPDQPFDVCVSYLEEACAGHALSLSVILFNVDDYDSRGAIPSHYANITKTAECLRAMAHCSRGRFHWFRETGQ